MAALGSASSLYASARNSSALAINARHVAMQRSLVARSNKDILRMAYHGLILIAFTTSSNQSTILMSPLKNGLKEYPGKKMFSEEGTHSCGNDATVLVETRTDGLRFAA